jgi:hypothetical protein
VPTFDAVDDLRQPLLDFGEGQNHIGHDQDYSHALTAAIRTARWRDCDMSPVRELSLR